MPTSLITLELISCRALRKIGGLSGLSKLQGLDMRDSHKINVDELPGREIFSSLLSFLSPRDKDEIELADEVEGFADPNYHENLICSVEGAKHDFCEWPRYSVATPKRLKSSRVLLNCVNTAEEALVKVLGSP